MGGGLEDSDGGYRVIVLEGREVQVGTKGDGIHRGRLHDTQGLLRKIGKLERRSTSSDSDSMFICFPFFFRETVHY